MAGLSLFLALVVVVVLLARDGRQEVDPGPVDVPRASPADAALALTTFATAVDARDTAALVALAPRGDVSSADLMGAIAANADSLDLREVTARYVDQVGTVRADGSWSGIAEVTWQMRAVDAAPARAEVVVAFAPAAEGLSIAGFGTASERGRVPLWLRGKLSVSRAAGLLVMVDGPRSVAAAVALRVRRGIAVVRNVLPSWRGPVAVEVPASASDLEETLGVAPGTYAGIAAVTAAVGDTSDAEAPVHIFVSPDVTSALRRAGAQVVMSHELVHLATDAVRTPMEPWLLEGFADYVALRDTRLRDRTTLSRAIAAVRRDGVPDTLPTAADFDTRAADLQASYEQAWLACRIIAERLGERGLVIVYEAVAGGRRPGPTLRRLGLPADVLRRAWTARLAALAG